MAGKSFDDFDFDDFLSSKEILDETEPEKDAVPQEDDFINEFNQFDEEPSNPPTNSPDEKTEKVDQDPTKSLEKAFGKSGSLHEAIRDLVFANSSKDDEKVDGTESVKKKRKELHEVLDNLDKELEGKTVKEVTAIFVSLLDIQSQLCMQKTDGVISVRTRLSHFFPSKDPNGTLKDALRQEISLIFTPEEVKAVRGKLPDMKEEDPLKPFFTAILDQAYDVVQYNEMTGRLLNEMTHYFIKKLENNGYGGTTQCSDFKERHERAKMSLNKAIDELKNIEIVINNHLKKYPILTEFPKLLRALINIKLGLLSPKHTNKIISQIQQKIGEYARARSAVAFDFNRMPSYQHGVRLRQSIILNLHKDIIGYTGELFQQEFENCKEELSQITAEIEAASETLDPNTPEYEELMQKKARIQKKLEEQRRKLDVVKSQETLVDVQHKMVNEAVQRYNKQEGTQKKVEEKINKPKVDMDKVRDPNPPSKKKRPTRMVMARKRH